MKIVAKFGGSSVRDADAIKRCCDIIQSNEKISLVVVSATYNTTNELELIAGLAIKDVNGAILSLDILLNRHERLAKELILDEAISQSIKEIKEEAGKVISLMNTSEKIESETMDEMYSFGERLSTLLVSNYLHKMIPKRTPKYLDARTIIQTNSEYGFAKPNIEEIRNNFKKQEKFIQENLIITQGFIGACEEGRTTTLGREGSDYSATLFAEVIDAGEVQIWTDVAGIATVDPKQVKTANFIESLSYEEAASMAQNGAKVLFPKTLTPARRKSIPVFVKSSLDSSLKGTKICKQTFDKDFSRISGLAIENGILTVVGINLINFEDKINIFLSEFGATLLEKESHHLKYTFENSSKLHVALYSLHGYLFSE
jgi:aspartate kinase